MEELVGAWRRLAKAGVLLAGVILLVHFIIAGMFLVGGAAVTALGAQLRPAELLEPLAITLLGVVAATCLGAGGGLALESRGRAARTAGSVLQSFGAALAVADAVVLTSLFSH